MPRISIISAVALAVSFSQTGNAQVPLVAAIPGCRSAFDGLRRAGVCALSLRAEGLCLLRADRWAASNICWESLHHTVNCDASAAAKRTHLVRAAVGVGGHAVTSRASRKARWLGPATCQHRSTRLRTDAASTQTRNAESENGCDPKPNDD